MFSENGTKKFLQNKQNAIILVVTLIVGIMQLTYHVLATSWTGHVLPTSTNGLVFYY